MSQRKRPASKGRGNQRRGNKRVAPQGDSLVGTEVEVEVGDVAHGDTASPATTVG
ncbi:hypothetical protein [Flexivirga alba]|uniref:Uncharacterized protein n=1 Tax=Flexivirga alba TaxID=702742 RepID=A0ABW2AHP7_9MICO